MVYNSQELPDPSSEDYELACKVIPASETIARYYTTSRGIPSVNIIGLPQAPFHESVTESDYIHEYRDYIATPIWNYLSQPEHSHIKCIVLCYGVPSQINGLGHDGNTHADSVDSALTLLGNDGSLGTYWTDDSSHNPYQHQNSGFGAFKQSAANATSHGDATWKFNYLVCRLDSFDTPTTIVNGVAIPKYVKDMIDKSVRATRGGKFVLDYAAPPISGGIPGVADTDQIIDGSSIFLTGQQDVVGYYGEHMMQQGNANNYTTWGRPFNIWHDGGIAAYNTNDGQSFRTPLYAWWALNDSNEIEPGKLKILHMHSSDSRVNSDQYAGHQVVLCDSAGNTIKRATFDWGTCSIDLASIDWEHISWPVGHEYETYFELRFPINDPMFPDQYIRESRTPHTADTRIYNSCLSGISFDCARTDPDNNNSRLARVNASAYIAEGATGAISSVSEPGGSPDYYTEFSRYAAGYTWAESAYMGSYNLRHVDVVLGDPLMAPFAAHPSVNFASSTPSENANVKGLVPIDVDATPDGEGRIGEVQFWITDSAGSTRFLASDITPSFEYLLDTAQYSDGSYTIEAVVNQDNGKAGTTTISRHINISNVAPLSASISQPGEDDMVVICTTTLCANAEVNATRVQFWLFSDTTRTMVGEAVSPFQISIPAGLVPDGVYNLQAMAYDDTTCAIAYSTRRRIVFVNNAVLCSSIADAATLPDGAGIVLNKLPVIAGTTLTMGNAFYVEDINRIAGLRIETSQPIEQGCLVVVKGTLRKSTNLEPAVVADQVWDMGISPGLPTPLALTNRSLGGSGIPTHNGLGNTGLLVRTSGKVTYVGADYFYIDDGTAVQDGNILPGPYIVPLDGGPLADPIPYAPPTGVLINCTGLNKPGIGDYVSVTGISSIILQGNDLARYLRPRSQTDIIYANQYANCHKEVPYGPFLGTDSTVLPTGSSVRLVNVGVDQNDGTRFKAIQFRPSGIWSYITANTSLPSFVTVTITGITVAGNYGDEVIADCIYLGGRAHGAMSINTASLAERQLSSIYEYPIAPIPQTINDILTSYHFHALDNRPNSIGCALSQPDGTVVDLIGEQIATSWHDGQALGLKEFYEPEHPDSRLVLYLPQGLTELTAYKQIDIVGGTLATLSNGQRAILYPQAVYLWTDMKDMPVLLMPKTYDESGQPEQWQWRKLVYSH